MLATSLRTGTYRDGHITVTAGDDSAGFVSYGFRYERGTGKARHDLTVYPHGGALAVGPLGEAVSDIAVRAAEALDPGPHEWRIERDATGITVTIASGDFSTGDLHMNPRGSLPFAIIDDTAAPAPDPRAEAFWSAAFCADLATLPESEWNDASHESRAITAANLADAALVEWRKRWGAK